VEHRQPAGSCRRPPAPLSCETKRGCRAN
jgi:hypothetical protein